MRKEYHQKRGINQPVYEIGDLVFLKRSVPVPLSTGALGPFKIIGMEDRIVELQDLRSANVQKVHIQHIRRLSLSEYVFSMADKTLNVDNFKHRFPNRLTRTTSLNNEDGPGADGDLPNRVEQTGHPSISTSDRSHLANNDDNGANSNNDNVLDATENEGGTTLDVTSPDVPEDDVPPDIFRIDPDVTGPITRSKARRLSTSPIPTPSSVALPIPAHAYSLRKRPTISYAP